MSVVEFLREFGRVAPEAYAHDFEGQSLEVIPAYPDHFIIDDPNARPKPKFINCITYQVIRREPATDVNNTGEPFQGGHVRKPRHREYQRPDDAYYEIYGMRFDNIVQFDCWTLSNGEADILATWLETFLLQYTFYFKILGVSEMFYWRGGRFTWGTTEDEAMVRWRNPYKVRSIAYYVKTERLWYVDRDEIEQIVISIDVD